MVVAIALTGGVLGVHQGVHFGAGIQVCVPGIPIFHGRLVHLLNTIAIVISGRACFYNKFSLGVLCSQSKGQMSSDIVVSSI
jgi:hypothetical protein